MLSEEEDSGFELDKFKLDIINNSTQDHKPKVIANTNMLPLFR